MLRLSRSLPAHGLVVLITVSSSRIGNRSLRREPRRASLPRAQTHLKSLLLLGLGLIRKEQLTSWGNR
jgi:hypothetical protein